MPQYKSVTVNDSSLDYEIDRESERQGRDGWRIESVTKESDRKARIQFVKD
ncbi:hypothetical protein Srot_0899 [Segniliparus rotundus DSM 44985]|uniref:DUF4177 domain-containing protein n=1 Tax=Segniliparus rotundus (strain ATCC BAA-972 / CDC 1076 / CIP 108378 / DSM 44985 / JCM 13578) TaxID=640132 RepID=D6ZE96_SEGRD|nr:hypothetical protein [Segniliparus rotundus]ADG97376.1 hypothetical protein Srot_0899 [Segniliparus rotundus DSM 44985]